tara:strand:+ start:255 stop:512 length:258 start_codon:yes stop_codon:yes gene_type:complete
MRNCGQQGGARCFESHRLGHAASVSATTKYPDVNPRVDIDDEGLRGTTAARLNQPALRDPHPKNAGAKAAADPSYIGNPRLDAVD